MRNQVEVRVGTTPAGVEWVWRGRGDLARMQRNFHRLVARHNVKAFERAERLVREQAEREEWEQEAREARPWTGN
jgi:hypothetical protein